MFPLLRTAGVRFNTAFLGQRQNLCRRLAQRSTHSEANGPVYQARRTSTFNLALLVVGFIPIFTFGLGTWQLRRLQWKISLIDELEEKLQREPLTLPKQINLSVIPEFVYRRVRLGGRWDYKHAILLGPRVRDGSIGFHLVMPLIRLDGSTVLVDRGFISKENSEAYKSLKEGDEVEVLGMLRTSQTRNNFTPDNHPELGAWYWADVDAMAKYAGGIQAGVQPVFVEEIFEGHSGEVGSRLAHGIPIGRAPTVDLRNAHLSYVITWYSLSVFTAFMFARLLLKRKQNPVRRLPR